ncbi:MAG: hypothetical protein ACKV2T_05995 [Kofleriaceae bacterium]
MSSPYRDSEIPVVDAIGTADQVVPLATFDVSGLKGADGDDGRHGASGSVSGQSGQSGGDAGPAQPGETAGRIDLVMAADDAAGSVKLTGEIVLARGEKREIRNLLVIDETGYIQLSALGGDGGRGGNGGHGGNGAQGHRGSDATRWSSGSDGGSGGNGGNGGDATSGAYAGDGGNIVVSLDDADTPMLMLLRHDIRGGSGGPAGRNGSGGSGGPGGRGGSSYSWTTTSTSRNSDGSTSTRTHHHSNPGGSSGSSGYNGSAGNAAVKPGANGEAGTFAIRVKDGDKYTSYNSRYDLRLVSFAHDSLNEDAVYEPRELVRVFDIEVENVGGMPTPKKDELALALASGGWIRPEPGELRCTPGLDPGARYKVPGELRFRIAEHTPEGPSDPLEVEESILQRAMLPSVRRDFERYQEGEAIEQGRFVIRYPVRISPITNLKSLAAGEATRVRFTITNQSRFALGGAADCKRVVCVRVTTAADSELGDEHVVLLADGNELSPGTGWSRELGKLDAGDAHELEISVRLRDSAPEYLRFAAHVTLELGDIDAPAQTRAIQLRGFDIRVARPFAVSDADLLLVVNHRTTREEIEAWEQLGQRLAFDIAIWDLSRERHLDLERPLSDGISLFDWFKDKAIVLLDNPIENPLGAPGDEMYPHVLLADDQLARAATSGIDIALIGKGLSLKRLLVPSSTPDEIPIYRRYWLRWWAKPTEDWLEKVATKKSQLLVEEKPTERHVVIYRFAPEIDKNSAWVNKWRVGTLHTARTLDAAAGAVVHADVDAHELHDPSYVLSDHAVTTLLAMFGFDENIERLRTLLDRDDPGERMLGPAANPTDLAPLLDALVLDIANELAAVIAPGWMGETSGVEIDATLRRLETLAGAKLTATYESTAGAALRRLAGRILFLARSQVAWWETLPPFRWMRRGPTARSRITRHVEDFLGHAFGEHDAEQAMDDAERIADEIGADHKVKRKGYLAGKRRVWALEQARAPIAPNTITSDTELLESWAERVMSGHEYDEITYERAADAAAREKLHAGADERHAELFVGR